MEPTTARERIVLLDVLRGFAVFGMFTVNMTTDLPWSPLLRQQPLDIADNTVMFLIDFLARASSLRFSRFCLG